MSATKMVESVQATMAEDDMVVKDVKEEVAWERKEKRKKGKKKSGGRTTLTTPVPRRSPRSRKDQERGRA